MAVIPLKIPTNVDPENIGLPSEIDPAVDVLSMAGVDLEDLNTHKILRSGSDMTFEDPTAGLQTLTQLTLDEKVKVTANDTTKDYLFNKLVAGAGVTLSELNDGGDEDLEIGLASLSQKLFSVAFTVTGAGNNKWFGAGDKDVTTNITRFVFPYDVEVIAWDFSNKNNDAYGNIQVFKNGITASELQATYNVVNSRFAWDSTITPIPFNAGDRLALFLEDVGTGSNPENTLVNLYFRITSNTTSSGSGQIT